MATTATPRRRTPARRVLVGAARIAALLAIIIGISGILVPALVYKPAFYAVALLFAVASFVLLRPPRREATAAALVATPGEPAVLVDESSIAAAREDERERWAGELDASESARAALARNVEELRQTILTLREEVASQQQIATQGMAPADAAIAELNADLGSARDATENLRRENARESEQREAEWAARVNELERALESERGVREEVATLARELQQQIATATAAHGDVNRTMDEERAARERAEAQARDLQARIEPLEQALESERDAARERVEELERDWNEKLQSIVNGMAADHENDLGEAIEQRETARAEARSLKGRVHELEQQLAARAAGHETDLREAIGQREAARGEVQSLSSRIEELEQQLASREVEWNEKLQKIVAGLAADHEEDVGKATMEREAARAEARHLTMRLQELQRQVTDLKTQAVDETALRAKIDAEWSEKLQTIVTHLASDHDEDIGKAVEEKEEAKAEARTLKMKLDKLQQQIERDQQTFLNAQEKWSAVRDSLTQKANAAHQELEQLQISVRDAAAANADPFPSAKIPTPEPFPALGASAPSAEVQRSRAEVLEIAEQAHAVLKHTAPGSIPVPQTGRRPIILFVHHDPTMRTMWRDQLHRHGYDVVTAADGLEGLRIAAAQKPGVVIADAQMPKMDGRELCQLIKSNEQTAGAKVVLMSAADIIETKEGFKPDEVLRKPVKFEALQAALANLLAVPQ